MLQTLAAVFGTLIGAQTISSFIFYNKSQIDEKLTDIKKIITDGQLHNQEATQHTKDEIYEKLNENKAALESGMKEFINILSDIKESDKNFSVQLVTLVNGVKDELKNDYTSRYNDLLLLINTKADEKDFNRLEQKFDKLSETLIEVRTIVQQQHGIHEKSNR